MGFPPGFAADFLSLSLANTLNAIHLLLSEKLIWANEGAPIGYTYLVVSDIFWIISSASLSYLAST